MATSNTIKSFSLGYRATNAVINGVTTTAGVIAGGVGVSAGAVVAAASGTKQVSTGFFAGIKFAINERRNVETAAPVSKNEEAERKLREAQELYARAYAAKNKEGAVEGEFIPAAE